MVCPALQATRFIVPGQIEKEMPIAMRDDFNKLDSKNKLQFLLSGFNCKFNIEWISIYRAVLMWVNELYSQRCILYDNLESLTDG